MAKTWGERGSRAFLSLVLSGALDSARNAPDQVVVNGGGEDRRARRGRLLVVEPAGENRNFVRLDRVDETVFFVDAA
jgi:hypothetical protein